MRKNRSRSKAWWLTRAAMTLCLAAVFCVPALAASEEEENNSIETANPISVNTEVSGSISSSSDVDWYRFEVPEDGYISLTFSHDYVDSSSSYWKTSFYTSKNKELDYWTWKGNATTAGTGNENGIAAGTYYVCVEDYGNYSTKTYRFTVNYTPSDAWEKEFNETIVTANEISTGTEINGTIRNSSDIDWYKFELPEAGMISLTFDHDYVDSSSSYWRTSFYTGENKELDYWTWKGNATTAGTGNANGVAAGTYYVCVEDYGNYSTKTYHFTVNYTPSDAWEKEFNETIVTANEISTGTEINGTIRNSSDIDWYKFELPEAGMISLTFDHDYVDSSSSYWRTSFYTNENKELGYWTWKGNSMSAGTGSETGVPAGIYFVRVEDYGNYSTKTYRFTVNYKTSGGSSGDVQQPEQPVYASKVTLSKTSLSLTAGETATLTATVSPSDTTDKTVTWRSGNTKVATVSSGKVTAVGEGTTTITAACGSVSASCAVTVEKGTQQPVYASGVTLSKTSLSLTAGETATLTATVSPSDTTDKTVTWRSGNTKIATVSGGRVTAVGEGTTTITAACGSVSASCTVTVKAQEVQTPATEVHFERVTVYFQDQFTDVPANQWYSNSVAEAFELGLMKGNSATTFDPYGDVTIAETVTMAARIHSIYTGDNEAFHPTGSKWYQVYLDYAYENGIIDRAYYNCDVTQKASRAQFAMIFANSLPSEALAAVNSVADGAIPDVSMRDRYAEHIYKLYRAGILVGSDANGTFNSATYITRAEAAAIVSRMGESDNRVSITL